MTLATLSLICVVIAAMVYLRHEAELLALAMTQNMVQSVELSIDGRINSIDIALLASADEISRRVATGQSDDQSITQFLVRQKERLSQVAYLRAMNEQGELLWGQDVPLSDPGNALHEYYIRLQDDPNARLIVGKSTVEHFDKPALWFFARRINKPDGSFGGVVIAAVDVDQIKALLDQLNTGTASSIVLRDAELGLIARSNVLHGMYNPIGDARISRPFHDALTSNPQEGAYSSGAFSRDGIDRIHSYRRSAQYGYVVNVGIPREVALAGWRKDVTVVAGLVTAFVLALLTFSWLIHRAWLRQERDIALLSASQESLREAQQIANLGHYVYDLVTDRWTSSEILDDIFGIGRNYQRDARNWLRLVAPEARQKMRAYLEALIEQRLPFDQEYPIVRASDGQKRWVHGLGKLHLDAQGTPLTLVGTIQDISARKSIEMALLKSEKRFRATFEQAAVGMAHTGLDGTWLRVNDKLCAITGYTREELLATTFQNITHPEDLQANLKETNALLAGKIATFMLEKRYLRKDGNVVWVNITVTLLRDDDDKPEYLISIIEDITERRRAEEALRQAQKMEAVGRVSGGIAHDFNNLLGVIIGNLELLAPLGEHQPDMYELVADAMQAAQSGADLTRRLLSFSRHQSPHSVLVQPNVQIDGIAKLLARVLGSNIELSLNLTVDLWPVVIDPVQLDNGIMNLAANARDAMPRGGKLSITTVNYRLDASDPAMGLELKPGDYTMIVVTDTGAGMAPEVAKRVFEPFFTTKGIGEGTGLGLSMLFGFAKQSGGHVCVESAPGLGTTFRLYLPRATGTAENATPTATSVGTCGRGIVVLVVEDNASLRRVAVRMFAARDYEVIDVDRAEAALSVMSKRQIHLLFSDVVMPGPIDGKELARQVLERWPGTGVLLTSGYSGRLVEERGEPLAGSIRLLKKPYSGAELAAAVDAVLHGITTMNKA